MKYNQLGNTSIKVSEICLGTMTFGEQNTESDAHDQLDYAISQGINFIDTAELYAVPSRAETHGLTEQYIGTWLASRKKREGLIVATKVSGPGIIHIRKGSRFNREHVTTALNNSLIRLQTDYIDLYQLHWPERKTNYFGRLGYAHVANDPWEDNFLEVLEILKGFIQEGKIRHIGISNETPWGAMHFLALSEKNNLPRMVSIQNPYSLLNRTFEVGLAEIAIREKIGLLAYSPLAFGLLSGKYFKLQAAVKGRINLFPQLSRYNGEYAKKAAKKYFNLANSFGISPAQMALAYVIGRTFSTSTIIGATSIDQLKENIGSNQLSLSNEILKGIEDIHLEFPNPAP